MNLYIYDPEPWANSYLSIKFFHPMVQYGQDTGRQIATTNTLNGLTNSGVLSHWKYLTQDVIARLKNDGNKVFMFHINDSSYLGNIKEIKNVDLIFKFGGIQQTRTSPELQISDEFVYSKKERPFLPCTNEWDEYVELRDAGKLIPMPHPPFYHFPVEHVPFENKDHRCCIRGGNHYLRFHLFLNLMKHQLASTFSEFATDCYFMPSTVLPYRYCQDCLDEYIKYNKVRYSHYKDRPKWSCNNEYMSWQQTPVPGFFQNENTHKWNNRCVPLFYWLTEQFEKYHGPVDKVLLEASLNGKFRSEPAFYESLKRCLFYGDYKWMFSVDIPPRFWHAANAKSVNLLPRWTKNQVEFPEVREGDHYIAFEEDFSDLENLKSITKEQHDHITNNCFEMYEAWIKPMGRYMTSPNLLEYVFKRME